MIPPKIDLGLCPLCKGSGFRKDSDFTKTDCICDETGNKFFLFEPDKDKKNFDLINDNLIGRYCIKIDYKDKWLFDKIKYHFDYGVVYFEGHLKELYINSLNRIEPFYSLNNYRLSEFEFPPLEDPLFPFKRK